MLCCLNPDCAQPLNGDPSQFCQHCGVPLIPLLRNRFKIIKPIGRGGFGKTYLAEDTEKLNEPCVVKQLAYRGDSSADTQGKVRELFEREARQLQKLGEHPQIPALLAYFEEKPYLYLVQQYIQGQTLQAELDQDGPFNEAKIRAVLTDLLPVLQFVHRNGIVHRDLKPENIIRAQDNQQLILIDFGVAKVLSGSDQATPGTMLGSQGYSPLEQILEGKASPASDLFSLGATCFHLLSHMPPSQLWSGSGYRWAEVWRQFLPQGFSAHTIAVLNKLLQTDLKQRYQSCEEVLQDLYPASTVAQSSPPPPTVNTSPATVRSQRLPKGWILSLVAIALLIGTPIVWSLTRQPSNPPTSNNPAQTDPPSSPSPSNQLSSVNVVQLPTPDFQRPAVSPSENEATRITLVSAEPNLITDTTTWFQKHQLELPTYEVPNPVRNEIGNIPTGVEPKIGSNVIVKAIRSPENLLLLYGPDYSGGTVLYGYDEAKQQYVYGFDFSNYTLAPDNDPADLDFVEQRINWAQQEGNILYVSHGHSTYARSSRGMNAYITAIDLTTQTPLWTSQPLVANANNFQVLDEMIISGYGFTDEADYLYLLSKNKGAVLRTIPLDTAPEYIFLKDSRLLVRGYDIDYEFTKNLRLRRRP